MRRRKLWILCFVLRYNFFARAFVSSTRRTPGSSSQSSLGLPQPKNKVREGVFFQHSYPSRGQKRYRIYSQKEKDSEPPKKSNQKMTISKQKAISALSQKVPSAPKGEATPSKNKNSRKKKKKEKSSSKAVGEKKNDTTKAAKRDAFSNKKSSKSTAKMKKKTTSILPPPPPDNDAAGTNSTNMRFWEHFLGTTPTPPQFSRKQDPDNQEPKTEGASSNNKDTTNSLLDGVMPVSELFYRADDVRPSPSDASSDDDEEHDDEELPFSAEQIDSLSVANNKLSRQKSPKTIGKTQDRKKPVSSRKTSKSRGSIVRRGMEMFVGGVPVQADPPMRYLTLEYDEKVDDWTKAISLQNTREYGPSLHSGSTMTQKERSIFVEFFCQSSIKWGVLPEDLADIVRKHRRDIMGASVSPNENNDEEQGSTRSYETSADEDIFDIKGEFTFEIGVPRKELLACETDSEFRIFREVIARAFHDILIEAADCPSEVTEFEVEVPNLEVSELESWYSAVRAEFKVAADHDGLDTKHFRKIKKIGAAFTAAMDEGKLAEAIASAALKEEDWPKELRTRIAEECLFQGDDDESFEAETDDFDALYTPSDDQLVLPSDSDVEEAIMKEQSRFGGLGGIFDDFTNFDENRAPFQGRIGPRLVDAVLERAKMREPRVIAIGDVHGCIDELQELLRRCDYRPGDLVVFLGDLVCKGPDSLSVVQLAREIGAIGVRGNHDFEVIKWHQAILAGVDQPVFGSEHFHIVSLFNTLRSTLADISLLDRRRA